MERKEYNGWYNYETWLTVLWFDNDNLANNYRMQAQEVYTDYLTDNSPEDALQETIQYLEDIMPQNLESTIPEGLENGLLADLLNDALKGINWHDIAKHYVDDIETPKTIEELED